MFVIEIGACAQKMDTISYSEVNTIRRLVCVTDCIERKTKIFNLISIPATRFPLAQSGNVVTRQQTEQPLPFQSPKGLKFQ